MTWKDTYQYRAADAEKVNDELQSIDAKTPENIVEFAESEKAEMHKCFEWDTDKAASSYRLAQARLMVNHLVVEYTIVDENDNEAEIVINAYSSVSTEDGRQYVRIEDGVDNEVLQQKIISEVKSLVSQARIKMNIHKAFFTAKERRAVDKVLETLKV